MKRLSAIFPWLPPLEIGVGWTALVWDLAEDLEDLAGRNTLLRGRELFFSEVKSKYGGLRVSYHGTVCRMGSFGDVHCSIDDVISRAETRACHTCERCGRPGLTALHSGWLYTLCLDHHETQAERH
ncbi:hypothetical protein JMJ56_09260 [Belnapia sp. T18]|uniref:Uncharacterized protein n=1 Tax=Belnapia arida TaxID=2804533 RepID=A0ABS1U0J0_9PROT|nr:hypothetical protein [Belnapia arida]MBL6078192.1 hypothetical protein [Belnapia arida]